MPKPKGAMGSPYGNNETSIGEFMTETMNKAFKYDEERPKKPIAQEKPKEVSVAPTIVADPEKEMSEELFKEFLSMLLAEKNISIDSASRQKIVFAYKSSKMMIVAV